MTRGIHRLAAGLALPALLLAACEALTGSGRALPHQSSDPAPEVPPDDPPPPDAATPDDAGTRDDGDASLDGAPTMPPAPYETMCRHYCQMLDETLFYYCLGTGSDSATCRARFPDHAARCYQDRCVPQLVPASLCPRQCDSLATYYGAVCTAGNVGQNPLCPSSPADHDQACRVGCESVTPGG